MVPFGSRGEYSAEIRVRFPLADSAVLTPVNQSGSILTLVTSVDVELSISLQYEKPSVASMTGTIFVTSSAGRLDLPSIPIFDQRPYCLSMVKEAVTGSFRLTAIGYEGNSIHFSTSSVAFSGSVGYPG